MAGTKKINKRPIFLFLFLNFFIFVKVNSAIVLPSVYNASYSSIRNVPDDIWDAVIVLDLKGNDISWVGIGDLLSPNLQIVNLTDNVIYHFDMDAFCDLSRSCAPIREVLLGNNDITSFPDMQNVGDTLLVLDLSYNGLLSIPDILLNDLAALEELYLAGNPFSWIDGLSALRVLKHSLVVLDLSEAVGTFEFPYINIDFVVDYDHLEEMYIPSIDLPALPIFDGNTICKTLRILDAGYNGIGDNDIAKLHCFETLKKLHLPGNLLSVFPGLSDSVKQTLTVLNLREMSISTIEESQLTGMVLLKHLNLADNKINQFPAFPEVMNTLLTLNLSQNLITDLETSDFYNIPYLIELDISKNLIIRIPNILPVYQENNQQLVITAENNPFHCNCTFAFTFLATDAFACVRVTLSQFPCGSPQEYAGVAYWDVLEYAFCTGKVLTYLYISPPILSGILCLKDVPSI